MQSSEYTYGEQSSMADNETKKDESLQEFSSLGKDDQELIKASVKARDFAYCPYSQFSVGAAVRVASGSVFSGCNIENSAYPVSVCAERTAIAKAVSEGNTKLTAVAVCAVLEPQQDYVFPCGSCRQFINEFSKDRDVVIYLAKPDLKTILISSIRQLLPHGFHF